MTAMRPAAQWSYRIDTHPSNDRTTLTIQTVVCGASLVPINTFSYTNCVQPPAVSQRSLALVQTPHQNWLYPPTPRIPLLNLHGQPVYPVVPQPLFPFDLLDEELSPHQWNLLSDSIPASTTITIRDNDRYVLFNVNTGTYAMAAADLVQFLQFLVRSPLPSNSYAGLSPAVRNSVGVYFQYRTGSLGPERWRRYALGIPRFGSPTGFDLFLGKVVLWGLDDHMRGVWTALVSLPQ
ncbi:hypothetical protein C8R43DRAFT_2143 [Mycena crocata]|nr:hypothetical protein C8R43DRAFT_2143 [Mycena crocata]